ncbi:hypothetical protein ACFYZB_38200 [Streptomyces sp. NPDC001852]|uniref:hypothetical protein n=1 Tax=Streptomyces sp. NPDC001852 TaxID=3364619 RepID=UPI0036C81B5A
MSRERTRQLSTAEERRETVLRIAIGAFAARGYCGTTTTEAAVWIADGDPPPG